MKLSKSKFPFLSTKNVNWFFTKDSRGEKHPFSMDDLNDDLHEDSLVRDYYSVPMLDKHWDLFEEVYLSKVMQHWKHFQQVNCLIMNNEDI